MQDPDANRPQPRQLLLPLFDAATPPEQFAIPLRVSEKLPRGLDRDLTALCRRLSTKLGLRSLASKVAVVWNARLQTTAGLARYHESQIDLNPRLILFTGDEVDRTMRHELAHLVAYARAGRRKIQAHGKEWRRACADLGIGDESRCHTLPFERRQCAPKFAYQCPGCGTVVTRVRKFARYSACYACCKRHNRGQYDDRFRFKEISVEVAMGKPPAEAR
ncbi:MAG: SprT-like domain-containing protein [Verrucomicrobiales bacterium]